MQTTIVEEEVAKFANYAKEWWQLDGAFRTLHDINPLRLNYITQHVSLNNQRVLDIGCGGGILSEALAKRGGIVTGLDVEPEAIEVAKKHASSEQLNIQYICQSLESWQAEPFPIITCMEMLEHVSDPQIILNEAARLLAPGGYLFLSTINRNTIAYAKVILAAEYVLGLLPRQTHDYQRFIKPSELAAMARSADLEVLDISGMNYSPLSRSASLTRSLSDNYLMVLRSAE